MVCRLPQLSAMQLDHSGAARTAVAAGTTVVVRTGKTAWAGRTTRTGKAAGTRKTAGAREAIIVLNPGLQTCSDCDMITAIDKKQLINRRRKRDMSKILLINGSSKKQGCTYTALREVEQELQNEGLETELYQLGKEPVRDCTACGACRKLGKCVYNDDCINELIETAGESAGFVFGTPVYYAHPSGRILSVLDRVFYAGGKAFAFKPGAAVASARRAGTTASLDVLNKYFTIARMPVVSSNYWNMVHGNTPEEVRQDLEGLQIMRGIGRNMAWLVNCIEAGKQAGIGYPPVEEKIATNFIH